MNKQSVFIGMLRGGKNLRLRFYDFTGKKISSL